MSLRDELRKSVGVVLKEGQDAASRGARLFNEWADTRAHTREEERVDAELSKAFKEAEDRAKGSQGDHAPAEDPKSWEFDPFDLVAAMGHRERPTSLTMGAMEVIGRSVPPIADVITTRVNQVSMFTGVPDDRHAPGFKVQLRDRNAKATKASDKLADELTDVVLHTGYVQDDDPSSSVPFHDFARVIVGDSLRLDQATFEIVPDRKGKPSYLAIVDPATIRLLDPGTREKGDPFAVQVMHGAVVADFTRDELAFCVRNPRSGIHTYGYGLSEIETLIREITGILWGMQYNRSFFTQGAATKGILNFKGTIPDRHLKSFRRQWYAMISGVSNAWRTPITNAEELQWINMQLTNRDMEYSAWLDFLIKVVCARYQIATEEVNFSYGNTGQSQAMGNAPTEEKIAASKDLGLRPLVRWLFAQVNDYLVQRIDPDFEAIPVGLGDKGGDHENDSLEKTTKVYMTVDEARIQVGLDAMPDGKGEVILNPVWLQFVQGKEAAEQGMPGQEEGGGDEVQLPGAPEDGEFGSPDEDNAGDFDLEDVAEEDEDAVKSLTRRGDTAPLVSYTVDVR